MNKKRMLVAYDGSMQSMGAVHYLTRVIAPEKLEVILFHVINKMPESYYDAIERYEKQEDIDLSFINWYAEREKTAREFMDAARNSIMEAGVRPESVKIDIYPRKFGVAADILAEAECGYDAVVIGRTGRSQIKDFLLGSIAHKVVQLVGDIPVWTVGGAPRPGNFLIAVDGSMASQRVVDYVGRMVCDTDFKLTLFHAARELRVCRDERETMIEEIHEQQWQQRIEGRMQALFDEYISRLAQAGVKKDRIRTKLLSGVTSRAAAIIKEAEEGGYETIVAGRRGMTKVSMFRMGGVTNKLIQHARDKAVWIVG